jgi:hypothetical protein
MPFIWPSIFDFGPIRYNRKTRQAAIRRRGRTLWRTRTKTERDARKKKRAQRQAAQRKAFEDWMHGGEPKPSKYVPVPKNPAPTPTTPAADRHQQGRAGVCGKRTQDGTPCRRRGKCAPGTHTRRRK